MTTSAAGHAAPLQPPADFFDNLARESRRHPVHLNVGQLIDGVSDVPLRNVHVAFDSRGIIDIEPAHKDFPKELSLPNFTLMPCLIEAHAHLFLDGAPVNFQQRENYLKESPHWLLARAR